MKTEKFHITGMTCAACQANVTRCVNKLEGVQNVNVSLLGNMMTVEYDEEQLDTQKIENAVMNIGYGASLQTEKNTAAPVHTSFSENQQKTADHKLKQLIASIVLVLVLMYIAMGPMIGLPLPGILNGTENMLLSPFTQLLITTAVVILNKHFFISGLKGLIHRAPNMDTLVSIGAGAALIYGIFAIYRMMYAMGHGDMETLHQYAHSLYFESCAMILTLVSLGKYLESRSKAKTTGALEKLINLAPKTATVLRNDTPVIISSEDVLKDDIVIIKPGDSIPADGTVISGHGLVDQAAITGESIPVEKNPGDTVISATINKNGSFQFRASRVGKETTLSQIIQLVEDAGNSKAPIARLADKISGIFVPIVIIIALVTAMIWLITGHSFEFALNCAISVLVISCPCALGLATPVAIMVGTGKAAEFGILIKSAESLEQLHSIDTVVLDKTGTITSGHPSVTDIIVCDGKMSRQDLLKLAAAMEAGSEHPLAEAVLKRAKEENIEFSPADDFKAYPGKGVSGLVEGKKCYAGNIALLAENGLIPANNNEIEPIIDNLSSDGKTPLIFVSDGIVSGIIAVADTVKDTSRTAIKKLQDMKLNIVMLTGDTRLTASALGKELGISEVISQVLPTDKEACIRKLQEEGRKVAMVGDGINDAPALTRADIGIAVGAGTDIAIDSADIVLMKSSLEDIVTALKLSKAVIKNIHMNLFWAFFYNILGIPLAAGVLYPAFGLLLSPMIGSAAMSISSVCVVTNALRLRYFKRKDLKTMKKILIVEGMSCSHCQMHVQKALTEIEGVADAQVNLETKEATVTLSKDVSDSILISAVSEAGYEPVGCRTV